MKQLGAVIYLFADHLRAMIGLNAIWDSGRGVGPVDKRHYLRPMSWSKLLSMAPLVDEMTLKTDNNSDE